MKRRYMKNIFIKADISKETNCTCDMCFCGSRVIKLLLPETKFHNGKDVSTVHHQIWMCESCRDKLVKAISIPYPHDPRRDGDPHDAGQ